MGCGASATPRAFPVDNDGIGDEGICSRKLSDAIIDKPVHGTKHTDAVLGSPVRARTFEMLPGAVEEIKTDAPEEVAIQSLSTASSDHATESGILGNRATLVQGLADAALASVSSNPAAAAGLVSVAAAAAKDMPVVAASGFERESDKADAAVGLADAAVSAAGCGSATAEGFVMAAAATAVEAAQARSKQ